jgi:hypothetical protein
MYEKKKFFFEKKKIIKISLKFILHHYNIFLLFNKDTFKILFNLQS